MSRYELTVKANKIVFFLVALCFLMACGGLLGEGRIPLTTIFTIIIPSFVLLIISGVLAYKEKYPNINKYLYMVHLFYLVLFIFIATPSSMTYLLIFFAIVLITIYQDKRMVIITLAIVCAMSNYFYFNYWEFFLNRFKTVNLIFINILPMLFSVIAFVQIRFTQKMFIDQEAKKNELLKTNEVRNEMLENIKYAIEVLKNNSTILKEEASNTEEISENIVEAFNVVCSNMEQQASNIEDINSSIRSNTENIHFTTETSNFLRKLSNTSNEGIEIGNKEIQSLSQNMQGINSSFNNAFDMFKDLVTQTEKVDSILQVIHQISEQTNLLSLNASIEAARAGEHGRGFAVVAEEVRKLAESSKIFTEEISEVVTTIKNTAEGVSSSIGSVQKVIGQGIASSETMKEKFASIFEANKEILYKVMEIDQFIEKINNGQAAIAKEISEISNSNTNIYTSFEEVYSSISEQSKSIEVISKSITEINELVTKLNTQSK